jgi:hypothetical protein
VIEVDASRVTRGVSHLSAGLARTSALGMTQAGRTATKIRERVPVLTGRLRASVHAEPVAGGGQVLYGDALPYARKIERHKHAVAAGVAGSQAEFQAAARAAAEREVGSL